MTLPASITGKTPHPTIEKPGIYADLTFQEYHDDPCIRPSLSAGVACSLVTETPLHAVMKHKRLRRELLGELADEAPDDESNGASRLGSVAHELLLGRGSGIHVITESKDSKGKVIVNPTTYSHDETKRIRDEVLKRGAVPCLVHELAAAEQVADEVHSNVRQVPGCENAFHPDHGRSEVAVFWQEPHLIVHGQPVWGRCLIDWWEETGHIHDLKTTGRDLSDEALARKIDAENLDLRAAWYLRGVWNVRPDLAGRIDYRIVFAQQAPPYETRVVVLDGATLIAGQKKVAYALRKWAWHLERGYWPGYPKRIETMTMPRWAAARWEDREQFDAGVIGAIANDPVVSAFTTESRDLLELKEIAP